MLKKIIPALILTFILASAVSAESPLTNDQIERVINTLEQLDPYMDQIDAKRDQTGAYAGQMFGPDMFNKECELIYSHNAQTKKIIEANGFTHKTWPETAGRVFKAITAIGMTDNANTGVHEMEKALAQIEADPSMSPQQKEMLKQHMQSALSAAKSMMGASKADIEAVKPYYDRLSEDM
ncbi:hypothetical protein [Maridesulfovibrio hydrothermalis]|uniref:LTXXQ motif family protein n=1 Tax=Maridesulfovibrio hydrothermalis AM13 = DSM 14728 TaxID=1121451 RepID=L0RBQ2_9BACT|nr:hypothetical protein [Maridesulfovibrio hydrothermalis]CCO24218.1 conserved exported protein of unknown function [Maridesulfovibrio hydrothermalis AM13 = DSM 14728]